MFGKRIYPVPGGNLMNPVILKNIGGKITEFILSGGKTKTLHQNQGRRKFLHEIKVMG